jgi:esterase/lipase superfamily enzyme
MPTIPYVAARSADVAGTPMIRAVWLLSRRRLLVPARVIEPSPAELFDHVIRRKSRMNREYHRWYSDRLGRDMELLVFGHAGAKVLVFPTRDGRFHEYEDLRLIEALGHKIDAGHLQVYCVDSIVWESLYCDWCHPADRIRRHCAFEEYVLNEVLPLMAMKNPHPCTIAHGCSLGAFHAVNIALRHPHLFKKDRGFFGAL